MSRTTVLDNEYFTVWYYPDEKIVHHRFHRFTYEEIFKECLRTVTELMKQHGAAKWLADDFSNGPIRKEDTEWCMTQWEPRTLAAGWRFWAVIPPKSVTGQMFITKTLERAKAMGVTAEFFNDSEAAMEWLKQQ